MDEIKYMVIYLDNSCEVHFNSIDNSRIIISPCGTEFVHRTFSQDNTIKSSLKYRTAYPISLFSDKLNAILRERNRFCNDRPFISSTLLETSGKQVWFKAEDLIEMKWDLTGIHLPETKNPIDMDFHNFFYVWKSKCGQAEFRLHFNKQIVIVKYPIKVPSSPNDEYEEKCELGVLKRRSGMSKHLIKYCWNEEEFSVNHLPENWSKLLNKMVELIENNKSDSKNTMHDEISVKLPEAMPLSCSSTHLHKFDDIETLSEPKMIYLNQTYYKLFYKNKSIEIMCPIVNANEKDGTSLETHQDYLVSDTLTGRYYTCYSLNRRSGEVDEHKICIDNIPSFKIGIKKTLGYANILLKRINDVKCVSFYSVCYNNKKYEEIQSNGDFLKSSFPSVSIESVKNKSNSSNVSLSNETSESKLLTKRFDSSSQLSDIKKQYVIQGVGHFKYMSNKSIIINFEDKVKLYMDSYSLEMFLNNKLEKSFCLIFLPDNSQHEICLLEKLNLNSNNFANYINFLEQWIKWLIETEVIIRKQQSIATNEELSKADLNLKSMQAHLSQLKLFNYSINQKSSEFLAQMDDYNKSLNSNNESLMSVSNLLKENSKFLQNITK